MKPRMLVLMSAMTLIGALATPARPPAPEPQLGTDAASNVISTNPVPLINQPLVPDAAKPGGTAFALTVNGTGFVPGSVVKWNGSPLITTFVSPSRLRATVPSSDILKPGTASVTVVNPSPGGGASNVALFEVTPPSSSVLLAAASYGTADPSTSVAIGDFNRDGKLDLAVVYDATDTVSVLLGNGDGTFQAHVEYATGGSPESSVGVGDFNGDGKLDLVVANRGNVSPNVSILLGNGDGTFKAPAENAVGGFPRGVAVGDFNGDGKLDLAVAEEGEVSVLLGNGDGTFQPAVHYLTEFGSDFYSVAVGDFNGDGKLDLAVADNGATPAVRVLLGKGDGTFQPGANYGAGETPVSVAVGDFNRDGKLDLAVVDEGPGTVSVLLGNGDGTFQPAANYGAGSTPTSVAIGDFNGDGKLDLAVADSARGGGTPGVILLLGNGDGTFQAVGYGVGTQPWSVAIGDFNSDGRLDIAVADFGSATVSVLLQAPTISLSQTGLTFADQLIGTRSAAQTVTLTNTGTNTGNLTLKITGLTITGMNATDFTASTCPASLAPGAHCTISVTFTPSHTGPRTASISITDSGVGSPQTIALSGTGLVSGPNATLSPTSLTFATQFVGTTSPPQSLTLTNYGTAALGITNIGFTGADPRDFQASTCGPVAPGASCTISVTFTPKAINTRTATLSIADNASGSPPTVSLNGTGRGRVESEQLETFVRNSEERHRLLQLRVDDADQHGYYGPQHQQHHDHNRFPTLTFFPDEQLRFECGGRKVLHHSGHFPCDIVGGYYASVSVSDNGSGSPQQVGLSGSATKQKLGAGTSAVRSALAAHSSAAAPSPTGPSPVGTRVIDLVDSTRNDPFLADGTKRELLVRFWYPASLDKGCNPAEYTTPALWNYFSQLAGVPFPGVKTNSCLEAPIAEGRHPVVVFTHGYTGAFTDYTFIFEDLASRGYVVASVDHTYEATAVEFPDGRFVKSVAGSHWDNSWRTDRQTLDFAVSVRLADLRFVVDELEGLNAEAGSPFAGKLDTSRLALAGHSLGGMTALPAVLEDPRFKAGVLIDGWPDSLTTPTETPVLILAAGHEQWSNGERDLWNNLRGPRLVVNLRGAEHVTPSDLVWLAKGAVKSGSMGPDRTIAAIRSYIAVFLDSYLRGRALDPLVSGPSSEYPDAVVTTGRQPLGDEGVDQSPEPRR